MTQLPPLPLRTGRAALLKRLSHTLRCDVLVVGGGATGLGVALDAAARGLQVVLLESHDFAQGTSSRSTKLVHGGVRYLAQGRIPLVWEALHERARLLANAPHLAQPLPFMIPAYRWWEQLFYGAGLTAYDALAGRSGLGRTRWLSRAQALRQQPTVRAAGLRGAITYWDGQFDDARLALALARTAARHGALLLNYCRVAELVYQDGCVDGVVCEDTLTGQRMEVRSRCVVNATGVWVDGLRAQESAQWQEPMQALVTPSQGVHLVVDREFLPTDMGLMVPKTADGRVLFAVPWRGKVVLGTTDTPRLDLAREPQAFAHEVDFILRESARCLQRPPQRADVRSIWVGLRPLVRPPQAGEKASTQGLSREHVVQISPHGLVSVTGGKWTTYRAMASDVLRQCAKRGLLLELPAGDTQALRLVGADGAAREALSHEPSVAVYGSDAQYVLATDGATVDLGGGLSEAMVRFAARHEYACTVEDVLARRSRLLFLDARLAAQLADRVGGILREETGLAPQTEEFKRLAAQYLKIPVQDA